MTTNQPIYLSLIEKMETLKTDPAPHDPKEILAKMYGWNTAIDRCIKIIKGDVSTRKDERGAQDSAADKTSCTNPNALDLLKELRDTTPMVAQRKRIDEFLAARHNKCGMDKELRQQEFVKYINSSTGYGLAFARECWNAAWQAAIVAMNMGEPSLSGVEATRAEGVATPSPANSYEISDAGDYVEHLQMTRNANAGSAITIWKDATWKHWQTLDAKYAEKDDDWFLTIPLSNTATTEPVEAIWRMGKEIVRLKGELRDATTPVSVSLDYMIELYEGEMRAQLPKAAAERGMKTVLDAARVKYVD